MRPDHLACFLGSISRDCEELDEFTPRNVKWAVQILLIAAEIHDCLADTLRPDRREFHAERARINRELAASLVRAAQEQAGEKLEGRI